jgi:hypothetical protein
VSGIAPSAPSCPGILAASGWCQGLRKCGIERRTLDTTGAKSAPALPAATRPSAAGAEPAAHKSSFWFFLKSKNLCPPFLPSPRFHRRLWRQPQPCPVCSPAPGSHPGSQRRLLRFCRLRHWRRCPGDRRLPVWCSPPPVCLHHWQPVRFWVLVRQRPASLAPLRRDPGCFRLLACWRQSGRSPPRPLAPPFPGRPGGCILFCRFSRFPWQPRQLARGSRSRRPRLARLRLLLRPALAPGRLRRRLAARPVLWLLLLGLAPGSFSTRFVLEP